MGCFPAAGNLPVHLQIVKLNSPPFLPSLIFLLSFPPSSAVRFSSPLFLQALQSVGTGWQEVTSPCRQPCSLRGGFARSVSGPIRAGRPSGTTGAAATAAQWTRSTLHLLRARRRGSLTSLRVQHCLKPRGKPYACLSSGCPQGGGRQRGRRGGAGDAR